MNFWQGKRVFLTGHTGFKGAWLTVWLHSLGAKVAGYSLAPDSTPNLYDALQLEALCERSIIADITDAARLQKSIADFAPDIVIHMAAQALVRRSYREPLSTIATNISGTANVLEACRNAPSVRAALIITTDKCYKNKETGQAYNETDELGGRDIYSASKACAEIITHAYRQSFFDITEQGEARSGGGWGEDPKKNKARICTARAGNVIGFGDWSEDRLIPDAVRAFAAGETLTIRAPKSLRPWQHVVEPLSGYLMLAQAMFENKKPLSPAYNFGPSTASVVNVEHVISSFAALWNPTGKWKIELPKDMPHEAGLLALDSSLAKKELGWKPAFTLEETLAHTAAGYREFYAKSSPTEMLRMMQTLCAPISL